MAIRIRQNGELLCAAHTLPEEGDIYLNDEIHYYLSQLTKAIRPSLNHNQDNLWFWNIQPDMLSNYADINNFIYYE